MKILLLLLVFIQSNCFAEQLDFSHELTSAMENFRTKNKVPAMAIAVISDGKVVYNKGFGSVDLLNHDVTTNESLFRVASVTKLFTAQAIMRLVEQGKLSLDDKVGHFLPALRETDISIRQLLTHSSGITDVVKPQNHLKPRKQENYLKLVNASFKNNNKINRFEYSDTNFNILGAIISAVSGLRYEEYVQTTILDVSGMLHSGFFNSKSAVFSQMPPTYQGRLIDVAKQRPYDESFNASEGLITNTQELSQWLVATMNRDNSLLRANSYNEMLKPQIKTSWGNIYMGLGWQVYQNDSDKIARHPGSIKGFKSLVLMYPDKKNGMIVLSNSSNTPRWNIAKSATAILKKYAIW